MRLHQRKPLLSLAAAATGIVAAASVVDLFGGPELFGRFQPLVLAVAMVVWLVTLVAGDESRRERRLTTVGLVCAGILLVGTALELVV